jgi:hypothetical protein
MEIEQNTWKSDFLMKISKNPLKKTYSVMKMNEKKRKEKKNTNH